MGVKQKATSKHYYGRTRRQNPKGWEVIKTNSLCAILYLKHNRQ